MTKPIVIKRRDQLEFAAWFVIALKELNNHARIVQIAEKLDEYISHNLIQFRGELCFEWQYQMRWVKTKLKEDGVISQKKQGNLTFWSINE